MISGLRRDPPIHPQAQRYAHLLDEMGPLNPACWSWLVTDADREQVRNCPEHFGHILLWNWQCGRCAICAGVVSIENSLVRDHDHRTGLVRGLLCQVCNTNEGMTAALGTPGFTTPDGHGGGRLRTFERWRNEDKNQLLMERFARYRAVTPCSMLGLRLRYSKTLLENGGLMLPDRYEGDLLILDLEPRLLFKYHLATRREPRTDRRLEDLRAYIEWRTKHPDTPLPTRRRRAKAARDNGSTEEENRG